MPGLSMHLSVHHAVCPCTFLDDDWRDFLHNWYHDQIPWSVDAHKIEFEFIPNLSNYGIFFLNFKCLL